jgi:hypothetical protein
MTSVCGLDVGQAAPGSALRIAVVRCRARTFRSAAR